MTTIIRETKQDNEIYNFLYGLYFRKCRPRHKIYTVALICPTLMVLYVLYCSKKDSCITQYKKKVFFIIIFLST